MKTGCSLEDLQQMLSSLLYQTFEQKFTEKMKMFQNKKIDDSSQKPTSRTRSSSRYSRVDSSSFSNRRNRGKSPSRPRNRNSKDLFCTHCNKVGHLDNQCFFRNQKVIVCSYCKKPGHVESRCYTKLRNTANKYQEN